MNYQRNSNQPPSASIRAGLSVQELKAMTAMRMATNEPSRGHNNNRIPPMNSANSYQTATPQQLQAAGIQTALSGSNSRSTKLSPTYGSARNEDTHGYSRPSVQNTSSLSPYHQQILSGGNKTIPPIQSVQELKALTQLKAQKSRAELVLHGGNPSTQYASAMSSRPPARNGSLQPLYGADVEESSQFSSRYQQQQRPNVGRISNIPVTNGMSLSDDEDSSADFALNKMLADYERRDRFGSGNSVAGDRDLGELNIPIREDSYSTLFSPSTAGSDDPLTPTNRSARNSGFSESFNGLSMLDRDVTMKQFQAQVSASTGTRPVKLGMISKSQSQPLIPLAGSPIPLNHSPVPGRKHAPVPTFLPELESPRTSRETTPKMSSDKVSPSLYSDNITSSGGNGFFPLIKNKSQTRIIGASSPSDLFGNDMAESVLDFLNSTPTNSMNKSLNFNHHSKEDLRHHVKPAHRSDSTGLTVSDLMNYTESHQNNSYSLGPVAATSQWSMKDSHANFEEYAPTNQSHSIDSHHHNNNEDDDAIRFDLLSRQSSTSEHYNSSPRGYSSFE